MKQLFFLFLVISSLTAAQEVSADNALNMLIEGNNRFIEGKQTHPSQTADVREHLSKGQQPFAIILSCSDSRVPPEIIFDQGLGNLFIIRVAGNVIDEVTAASIEYAAEHLHSPLLLVLGHEKCGAVDAAFSDDDMGPNLNRLLSFIKPTVEKVRNAGGENQLHEAVAGNINNSIHMLINNSQIIKHLVEHDKLSIVGGIYDLETGKLRIMRDN